MVVPAKTPDKCLRILIPDFLTDIRDAHLRMYKHVFPILQADPGEKLREGDPGDPGDQFGTVGLREMEAGRHITKSHGIIVLNDIVQDFIVILCLSPCFLRCRRVSWVKKIVSRLQMIRSE